MLCFSALLMLFKGGTGRRRKEERWRMKDEGWKFICLSVSCHLLQPTIPYLTYPNKSERMKRCRRHTSRLESSPPNLPLAKGRDVQSFSFAVYGVLWYIGSNAAHLSLCKGEIERGWWITHHIKKWKSEKVKGWKSERVQTLHWKVKGLLLLFSVRRNLRWYFL